MALGERVRAYKEARVWAARENLGDILDSARSGYWQEIIHAFGAEAPTILSQRMEIRRAFARRQVTYPGESKPVLEPIRPGRLKI